MKKFAVFLLIGVVLVAISELARAQEVSIYGGDRGPDGEGHPDNGDGEVQDESELASALGIDRQALYEDLMRIQEELGGSPMAGQNSQEDY